MRKGVFT